MIQVGDLVKHTTFNDGVGVVIEIERNRYHIKWVDSPYNSKHSRTWLKHSQIKLMETK